MSPQTAENLIFGVAVLCAISAMIFFGHSIYRENVGRPAGKFIVNSYGGDGLDGFGCSHEIGICWFVFETLVAEFVAGFLGAGAGLIIGGVLFSWWIPQ